MMQSCPTWSRETEALEATPLLGAGCNRRGRKHSPACAHSQKGVPHHHTTNYSQLESSPSCSQPPFHRRSFSTGSLSPDTVVSNGETSSLSPELECKCSEQHQPLLSSSEPFHRVRNWVELRLENSGSVARDHLASERTFLSYMRTSLTIASSGVALVQLFSAASVSPSHPSHRLQAYIRPLGASTVVVGLVVLFIGITRYFTVQVALTKGFFPVARLATGFVAMMLGVIVALTFGILLAGKLEPKVN